MTQNTKGKTVKLRKFAVTLWKFFHFKSCNAYLSYIGNLFDVKLYLGRLHNSEFELKIAFRIGVLVWIRIAGLPLLPAILDVLNVSDWWSFRPTLWSRYLNKLAFRWSTNFWLKFSLSSLKKKDNYFLATYLLKIWTDSWKLDISYWSLKNNFWRQKTLLNNRYTYLPRWSMVMIVLGHVHNFVWALHRLRCSGVAIQPTTPDNWEVWYRSRRLPKFWFAFFWIIFV